MFSEAYIQCRLDPYKMAVLEAPGWPLFFGGGGHLAALTRHPDRLLENLMSHTESPEQWTSTVVNLHPVDPTESGLTSSVVVSPSLSSAPSRAIGHVVKPDGVSMTTHSLDVLIRTASFP